MNRALDIVVSLARTNVQPHWVRRFGVLGVLQAEILSADHEGMLESGGTRHSLRVAAETRAHWARGNNLPRANFVPKPGSEVLGHQLSMCCHLPSHSILCRLTNMPELHYRG
jgi:hypothetical protein